jgi:hypothetical protein
MIVTRLPDGACRAAAVSGIAPSLHAPGERNCPEITGIR